MNALPAARAPEFSSADANALVRVIQDLASLRERDDLMRLVRESARRLTGADGITFVLREGDEVFYADEDAIAPLWKNQRFAASACVSGWVCLNKRPAVIPDIYADPRVPQRAYRSTFVKSMAMVPIGKDEPVGAIGCYWAMPHTADERELALLETLANASAVALNNLRLFAQEQEARRAAEHEYALRNELLAIVTHDVRNPLNSIQMSTAVLGPLVAPLNGRAQHHVDLISRSARRINGLIHDLLDFASIAAGQLRVEPHPVLLGDVMAQVADFTPLAHEKGVELIIERERERDRVRAEDSLLVTADLDRVHQVFSNLVGNSLKFTPSGGVVKINVLAAEHEVLFSVADTGVGFPPEFLANAFERKGRSTSRPGQGIGLGLTIAKGIVHAHGRNIVAENLAEGGAKVTFGLPRATD